MAMRAGDNMRNFLVDCRHNLAGALTILTALCAPVFVNAATVANGSFELATAGGSLPPVGSFAQQNTTANNLDVWTLDSGSVDWTHTDFFGPAVAYDGDYFLDLNGANLGAISSVITGLVIGQDYQLSFAMSGNPRGPSVKTLDLTIGTDTQSYSFDYLLEGVSGTDLQWKIMTFDFTASSMTGTLTFESTTASSTFYGPLLDGVTVTAVPLPMAAWLFGSGFIGLIAIARRKQTA